MMKDELRQQSPRRLTTCGQLHPVARLAATAAGDGLLQLAPKAHQDCSTGGPSQDRAKVIEHAPISASSSSRDPSWRMAEQIEKRFLLDWRL